ncbi:MAG: hypothetical protein EBR07_10055, partial [Planctomycetes bacterium]|nr:hypothetical protein [Planctomycetota bacterium]
MQKRVHPLPRTAFIATSGETMNTTVAILSLALANNALAQQWHQSTGTASLNMQSLLARNGFVFAGGATGAYRSSDAAASFAAANSGNDAVGPTRGYAF